MKFLATILGTLLTLGIPAGAQNAWPVTPEQQLHVKVVRAERTAAFFAAWEVADEQHRARATSYLQAMRSPGAPEGRLPSLTLIAVATRVLGGADPDLVGSDDLQRFADALDLQVSPGFFAPRTEGEGEPMTVRFYRLLEGPFHEDVRLSLLWVGPDGAEIRARSEEVAARHFGTPGQVMYLRAPATPDGGWWRLVPEVAFEGRAVRGAGVLVCAIPSEPLEVRADPSRGDEASFAAYARAGLRAASFRNTAESVHPLVSRLFTPLRSTWPATEPADPGNLRFRNAAAVEEAPDAPPRRSPPDTVFLVLAPVGECAESVFLGPVGDAWGKLARDRGAELYSVEFTRKQTAELLRRIEAWKAASREVILVARGDAVTPLPFVFAGKDVPVDGIVLCTETSGYPRNLPGVPTLLVAGSTPGIDPGRNVEFVLDPSPVFLRERTLPDRIAAWLAAEDEH